MTLWLKKNLRPKFRPLWAQNLTKIGFLTNILTLTHMIDFNDDSLLMVVFKTDLNISTPNLGF